MKVKLTENELKNIVVEELSKSEITNLIRDKISSNLDSVEFKKKVKEISADIVSNLFKTLWQQNSMWKRACQQ